MEVLLQLGMFIDSKKGKKRNKEASIPLERTTLHMTKLKQKEKEKPTQISQGTQELNPRKGWWLRKAR
jgi:hypothetical protein